MTRTWSGWLHPGSRPETGRGQEGDINLEAHPWVTLLPLARSHLLKVLQCSQTAQPSVPVFNSCSNYNERSPSLMRCGKYKLGSDYEGKSSCSLPLPSAALWVAVMKVQSCAEGWMGGAPHQAFIQHVATELQAWTPHLCQRIHTLCCTIFFQKPQ